MMADPRFQNKARTYFFIAIFPLLLLGGGLFFCLKKQPFGPGNFLGHLKQEPQWEMPPLQENEKKALDVLLEEPFTYLGAGAQHYAFLSRDGKTVVKFFRAKTLQPKLWGKSEKLDRVFSACKLAYTDLRDETGILFMQLNPSQAFSKPLQIIDRHGKSHAVNLSTSSFLVQKRVDLLYDHLRASPNPKASLVELFRLIRARSEKGIADADLGIRNNFGFCGDTPFQIDIGRLYRDPALRERQRYSAELQRVATKLKAWAEEQNPALIALIEQAVQQVSAE